MSLLKKQLLNTTIYNLLTWVSKLAVFPIIVKSFDVSEYGSYGMLNLLIVYGSIVGSAELYAYLRKELPGGEPNFQLSMYKSVHLPFLLFIIALGFLAIALKLEKPIASLIGDINLHEEVFYCLIIIIFEIAIKDIVRFFVSVKKIQISNFLSFFSHQAWGLTIIALFFMDVSITILLWIKVKLITSFLSLFLGLYLIGIKKLIKAKFQIDYLFKALGFSYIILLGVFMTQTSTFLSRYFITEMISLKAVGLFFFALKLPQIAHAFSTNIINKVSRVHLIEAINRNELDRMRMLGGKLFIFNLALYTLLIFPIILNIDGLILIFGKEDYLLTKPLILVFFISNYFQVFSLVYYTYLFTKGRKDLLLYISIARLFANTFVLVLCISYLGILGTSIAFLISNLLSFLISYYPYRKIQLISFPFNSYKFLIIGGVVVVLFMLQLFIAQFIDTTTIPYLLISSFFGLLIPIALFKILNIVDFNIKKRKFSINWT